MHLIAQAMHTLNLGLAMKLHGICSMLIILLLALAGDVHAQGQGSWGGGGGLILGILQLLLIVVAIPFVFIIGVRMVRRANARDRRQDARLLAAVRDQTTQVVLDYRERRGGDRRCPACGSVIKVEPISGAPAQIMTSCDCELSNGRYKLDAAERLHVLVYGDNTPHLIWPRKDEH